MRDLTLREQILIALMVILFIAFIPYYFLNQWQQERNRLSVQYTTKIQQLETLQALEQEWQSIRQQPRPAILSRSLSSLMESNASRMGIQDRLQINNLQGLNFEDREGIQVRLNQLNLDEAYELIYFLL